MRYRKYLILPTQRIINTFYKETVTITDAHYELDHILAKLVELMDEARSLRGESPASHRWCEAFIASVHYEGMADYYEAPQDVVFSGALRKLYKSILTVFMQHDHLMHPDDIMTFHRLIGGDIGVGLFQVDLLPVPKSKTTLPGPVPWLQSS